MQVPPISQAMLSQLKKDVLLLEFSLLDEIGFNTSVKLPYKKITKFVENLKLLPAAKNHFLRTAYRFANDFFRTPAVIEKSNTVIAEACIFLASKALKIELDLQPDQDTLRMFSFAVKIECIH